MPDETEKKTDAAPPPDLDLRTRDTAKSLSRDMKRFDIFLIDTGWNAPVSKVVRSHLPRLLAFQMHDTLYELTPEQSIEILKRDPDLIGCDPTLIVYDLYGASKPGAGNYCGFRLNLGLMRHPEQALARLQEFARFLATNRMAECLDREVRRELHREGIDGMVKLLRETSTELLLE
jgi:hypothetical protein